MRNVYALLVGIDAYPNPPKPLSGCVNDALDMERLLQKRIEPEALFLQTLINENATRNAVIETFRSHLGKAGKGDTAFFYYAGHGSREAVPPRFRPLESDGMCETLVAWDSRKEGSWPIADKELRVMIAEVARRGAHVAIILDSCHSGSATREGEEVEARRTEPDGRIRPAETYWFFNAGVDLPDAENGASGGWQLLPSGRHVLLAACQDYQTAREIRVNGKKRGAFTYYLVQSMKKLSAKARYGDLLKRTQVLVGNLVDNQLPQGSGDLEAILFDGAMPERPPVYHVRLHKGAGWRLDAGQVHGIEKESELAVFPARTTAFSDLGKKIATVAVSDIDVAESTVVVREGSLPEGQVSLPAVLSRLPTPPLNVAVSDGPYRKPLEEAIDESPFLRPAPEDQAEVVVLQGPEGYRIRRPKALYDLAPPITAVRDRLGLVRQLEHIARWKTISELENAGSPLSSAVEMTVFQWDGPPSKPGGEPGHTPLPDGQEARLVYGDGDKPGRFTVRIDNRYQGDKRLFFCLLALDENFGVKRIEDASGELLRGVTWLRTADGISLNVPNRYHEQGVTQRRDVILLLVSEKPVDFDLLTQNGLGSEYASRSAYRSAGPMGVLESLLSRVGYREADLDDRAPDVAHQWGVQKQILVAERPAPPADLRGARGELELPGGIRLGTPEGLHARARLANAATAARTLGERLIPPPQASGVEIRPVALAGALASDGGLTVMELAGEGFAAVTPESPLWIESGAEIPPDEVPVALVFDGADWSMNVSEERKGQGVRYTLPALPAPRGSGDLAGKVWILFRSVRRADLPKA